MFHRHVIEAFAPQAWERSTVSRWYVSDEEYQTAVRHGTRLRSDAFAAALRAGWRKLAALYRGIGATAAGTVTGADGIRRHADGAIDIEHYEALARRARAEAAGEFIDAAGRWLRAATGR
jgi:hypothetical protein